MHYENMLQGRFLRRPNRFIAIVELEGREEICHVKNTGRCRELLVPGCTVWCQRAHSTKRKTSFDLIAVEKGKRLINMDSQAPNLATAEWLKSGGLGNCQNIRPEQKFGSSRFDFYLEREGKPMYLEVKGVTLENGGVCRFPDAPTQRGARHIRELMEAKRQGFAAGILFVIQMSGVKYIEPNDETDPEFGEALREASAHGVEILAMDCSVTPEHMEIAAPVEVRL